jgi:hypothetical protein
MTLILLFTFAFAGKLGDGWRGHPYGDAAWLTVAPGDKCKAHPAKEGGWTCWETIGSQSYDVDYMVMENIYTSVYISCSGYSSCQNLRTTLTAAWGTCSEKEYASGSMPDCSFPDDQGAAAVGVVIGRWKYNQYSETGYAVSIAHEALKKVRDVEAARAKNAAEGL